MIIPIELRFKADKDSKSAFRTEKTIKSHDVNSVEFHISIDGLELTDNHTAKILSIFHSSKSQVNVDCEIVEGKIIYKPDTNLISRHEHVTNYVYVYHNNQSLDVREFTYIVDLSKIDETSLEVKEVYDQSYADLLADFEQALSDYKDNLPQADSVRADIDEILNQFSEDSQAKLSLINEAESSRVDAEGQRDSAESIRVQSESQRVSAESNRVNAESERVLSEDERESAEEQRKIDHANRSAELAGKADKVVLENLVTNGDFSDGTNGWVTSGGSLDVQEGGLVFTITKPAWNTMIRLPNRVNAPIGKYYWRVVANTPTGLVDFRLGDVSNSQGGESGAFDVYSNVVNVNSEVSSYQPIYLNSGEQPVNTQVIVKNVLAINLTDTFGAGNEPSKEEMDELINVTGYIDGEYALNNKKMLIWTLALIRRNKNAIIALGGTII